MINKYALAPLDPADIFSFKVTMAANQVDRDHEVFPVKTLEKLQELFIGKTVVKDHDPRSDNQIARIYETYLKQDAEAITPAGETYTQLIAKCYMIKTASNADLIAEINAGIRKEVSLGCRITKAVCSICDTDNVKSYCKHFPGQSYEEKTCFFMLEEPKDAYELSFVAVPAQREAGTVKSYGNEPISLEDMQKEAEEHVSATSQEQAAPNPTPERAEKADKDQGSDEKIAMIYETVKSLVEKMDDFLATVTQNNKETRSGETADFSNLLEIAQEIEEVQANAQASKNVLHTGNQDSPATQGSPTIEPSNAQPDSQMSEESEVSQGSKATESTDCCNKETEPAAEEETSPEDFSEDAAAEDTEKALKAYEAEQLALARLRSLDLSINILSK